MVMSANSPTGNASSTITEPSISEASHWLRAMPGCSTSWIDLMTCKAVSLQVRCSDLIRLDETIMTFFHCFHESG